MNSAQEIVVGSIITFVGVLPILFEMESIWKIVGLFCMGIGALIIFFPNNLCKQ